MPARGVDVDGSARTAGCHAARSAGYDSWTWPELDGAARSGHHGELRPERVLAHVMKGPAAQPEQRRDDREDSDRGKRFCARHADQQPGAEQRDGTESRHVEPGRLQRAQARRRSPRTGGYRALTATSDRHTARLLIQSMGELIDADYARPGLASDEPCVAGRTSSSAYCGCATDPSVDPRMVDRRVTASTGA